MGLRPLACWDCGFKSRQGHGCPSFVSVVCCRVEVSAGGLSLVQRSPTDCGVSVCDHESSIMKRPWPTWGCCATKKKIYAYTAVTQAVSRRPVMVEVQHRFQTNSNDICGGQSDTGTDFPPSVSFHQCPICINLLPTLYNLSI